MTEREHAVTMPERKEGLPPHGVIFEREQNPLSTALRLVKKENGFPVEIFAERLGISLRMYNYLLAGGRNPSQATLSKMSLLLNELPSDEATQLLRDALEFEEAKAALGRKKTEIQKQERQDKNKIRAISSEDAEKISLLLNKLRRVHDVTLEHIAQLSGVSRRTIVQIAHGKINGLKENTITGVVTAVRQVSDCSPGSTGAALANLLEDQDPTEKQKKENSQRWLRIFAQDEMTEERCIKAILLAERLKQTTFMQEAGINRTSFYRVRSNSSLRTVNSILEASFFEETSLEAQLVRIKSYREKPMKIFQELRHSYYGALETYLRVSVGLTKQEYARKLKQTDKAVEYRSNNRMRTPNESIIPVTLELFGLIPEWGLGRVVVYMARNPGKPVPFKLLLDVFDDRYLFAEHLPKPYILSSDEQALRKELKFGPTFGHQLRLLRARRDLFQHELGEKAKVLRNAISDFELSKTIPDDITIMKLMEALGFSIDHPIFWNMINSADNDRKVQDRRRKKRYNTTRI